MTRACISLEWQLDICVQAAEWSLRSLLLVVETWTSHLYVNGGI